MAKAAAKSITWILLSEAKARVDNFYQSPRFAEQQLKEWLSAGKLRWRSEYLEGSRQSGDPGSGDPEFWREPAYTPPVFSNSVVFFLTLPFVITWDQSCARRESCDRRHDYKFYRIEVAADDLIKLMPAGDAEGDEASTKAWITAEVKRMKIAGEIRPGIKITYFAHELKRRMDKAVRAGTVKKSVTWKYIKDSLPHWGLWPISSIN